MDAREVGRKVVVLDLDPQANLTAVCLEETELEISWASDSRPRTIHQAVEPLTQVGDLIEPELRGIAPGLNLIEGDVALAGFEETLSEAWPASMGDRNL